jgi:hypothetical protein
MALFGGSAKPVSIVIADVLASSIGVAYALIPKEGPATLISSVRIPVSSASEVPAAVMLRTLEEALKALRAQGAPILRTLTGSGSVEGAYACVSAAWQETGIRIETITDEKPFVFSAGDLEAAKKRSPLPAGRFRAEESVVATLLNGYETESPIGKKATRAEIILLSSTLPTDTATELRRTLGGFSSRREVTFSGFASTIHTALSLAFPHEKDYLALRVGGEATELVHVSRGLPIAAASLSCGMHSFARAAAGAGYASFPDGGGAVAPTSLEPALAGAKSEWLTALSGKLKEFAASRALPRNFFLLAEPDAREFLKTALDAPEMHALWLSDEPLSVIALTEEHFSKLATRSEGVPEDVPLSLLAIAAKGG